MILFKILELKLVRSVLNLLSSSVAASALSFLVLPFVARVYGPESIGVGVVFQSIHSLLQVAASGRYSIAIPLVESKIASYNLFVLSVLLSFFYSLVVAVGASWQGVWVASVVSTPEIARFLPLLGLSIFFASLSEVAGYELIRTKKFKTKAALGLSQTIATIVAYLCFFAFGTADAASYIFSIVIGISTAALASAVIILSYHADTRVSWRVIRLVAIRYRHLPKYIITTSFLNASSAASLPLVLASLAGTSAVAVYSVASQLVSRPLGMINTAIWQVVYGELGNSSTNMKRAADMLNLVHLTASLFYGIPVIVIILFPGLFIKLLGESWGGVSFMMAMLVCMAYFQYVSNSISYFQSFKKYAEESRVNMALVISRFGALFVTALLSLGSQAIVASFCVASSCIYLAVILFWSKNLGLKARLFFRSLILFSIIYLLSFLASQVVNDLFSRVALASVAVVVMVAFIAVKIKSLRSNVKL